MKSILCLLLIISSLHCLADAKNSDDKKSCRQIIVSAKKYLGDEIAANSFSVSTFQEEQISIDHFNSLSSIEQEAIYMRIKPLKIMVSDTIKEISLLLNRFKGSKEEIAYYQYFSLLRLTRDDLRNCKY